MNQIARWMLRLYPAGWRARYGDELEALLADSGADARVIADLVREGIRMQFSTWSFPRLAVILGSVGILIGLAFSLFTPPKYVARSELRVTGADSDLLTIEALRSRITSRISLTAVISNPKILLYSDLLRTMPLQDVVERMRNDIEIHLLPSQDHGSAIEIQFTYLNPEKARLATQELAAGLAPALQQIGAQNVPALDARHLDVIDTPSIAAHPLPLNPKLMGAAGLAAGLLLAFLLRLVSRGSRPFGREAFNLGLTGLISGLALVWIIGNVNAPFLVDHPFPALSYRSTAKLYVGVDAATMATLTTRLSSRTSMAAFISDPRLRLYPGEITEQPLEEVADAMRRDLVIASRSDRADRQWVDIAFTYPDRFKAQQTVQAVMARLDEGIEALRRATPAPATSPFHWGTIDTSAIAPVYVDSVSQFSTSPIITGFLAGFSCAVLIALFRRRWMVNTHDFPVQLAETVFPFDTVRFLKWALSLTAIGAVASALVVWRTPAHYASDAMVAIENEVPGKAAAMINNALNLSNVKRDLVWEQVSADGAKIDAFRLQAVSDTPRSARAELQAVLDEIDRGVISLHGRDDSPYEAIRGVDGALLPVIDTVVSRPPDLLSNQLLWSPFHNVESGLLENLPPRAIEPLAISPIPFDDERARPVVSRGTLAVRLDVIDTPSLPSSARGMGLWKVAIGAAGGLMLAVLLNLFFGFRGWFAAKQADTVSQAP